MTKSSVQSRACGQCSLCCKVFPVPVLNKPGDEWCKFVGAAGCSVHDRGPPAVCREYTCYWLDHEELPDDLRPDRIDLVVTESGTVAIGGETIPVFLLNQSYPKACRGSRAQWLLQNLIAKGAVTLVLCGPEMEMFYDRARYPGILPEDIEVAYRFERSQDAEELKRLGAVAEDYRPLTWNEAEDSVRRKRAE